MGNKCSCICSKNEEDQYNFTPTNPRDPDDFQIENYGLINDDYNTLVNTKNQAKSDSSIGKSKEDKYTSSFNTKDYSFSEISHVVRLQAMIRRFLVRQNYQKVLPLMRNQLEKPNDKHYKSEYLQYEFDNSRIEFNKDGWSKFYMETDAEIVKYVKVDFGDVSFTEHLKLYIQSPNSETPEEAIYSGQVNSLNQRHGFGELVTVTGDKYLGAWFCDDLQGWGKFISSDGTTIEGICIHIGLFIGNKLNGLGEKNWLNGNHYIGQFAENLRHGKGAEDTQEYLYQGDFENDLRQGHGKIDYKLSGEKYEGEFKANMISGYGTYIWANGDTYKGTFLDGKMHGKGEYHWPEGGVYQGEYINNLKEGQGRFKWANGRIFEGPFSKGKPHGKGILIQDEKRIEAEFEYGKLLKNKTKSHSSFRASNAQENDAIMQIN